jgi:hypothetical protein
MGDGRQTGTDVTTIALEYGATYWEWKPSFRIVNVSVLKAIVLVECSTL